MRGISILGVVVGGVFDIVITSSGAFVIAIVVGAGLFSGGPLRDVQHLAEAITNSTSITTILAIYGALISIAAGYLAARIANRDELLNGALSSFLCVAQGASRFRTTMPIIRSPIWRSTLSCRRSAC